MPRPLVSVAVVTYNHEPFIEACLNSVITQAGDFDLEVIVGEDCSPDGTRAVVTRMEKEYPGVICTILHAQNVGVHANWVAVLDRCRGDFIAQLDGDDLMRPGKVAAQLEYFKNHPEAALCFHNMRVFESATGATLAYFNLGDPGVRTLDDLVRRNTVYCQSSKMFRRSAMPAEGIDAHTRHIKDFQFQLQNARTGRIGYIDAVLGEYRKHSGGTTALPLSRFRELMDDQLYIVAKAKEYGASVDAVEEGTARIWLAAALRYLEGGLDPEFREAIERSRRPAGGWLNWRQRMIHRGRFWPDALRRLTRVYMAVRTRGVQLQWIRRHEGGAR